MAKVFKFKDVRKSNCMHSMMIIESDYQRSFYSDKEDIKPDVRPIQERIMENICGYDFMLYKWKERMCKKHGHNFDMTGSYASGEGAEDSFECSRCGFSFCHTYF